MSSIGVVSQEAADRAAADAAMPRFPPLRWLGMRCWRNFEAREQAAVCQVIDLARQPRWERKPDERPFRRTIAPRSYLAACDRFDRRDAMLARLRLQVAVEQYRRAHGKPPAELPGLAPEFMQDMPADPFTGEPFHYEPSDGGYRLYSQAETEGGVAWRGQDPMEYRWSVAQR